MRISDWSSDVCSSDLGSGNPLRRNKKPKTPAPSITQTSKRLLFTEKAPRIANIEMAGNRCCGRIRMTRSEEHTSELQSLMRISYAVFCLKKKKYNNKQKTITSTEMYTNIDE